MAFSGCQGAAGLTQRAPTGSGEVLLAAVEGTAPRIVRVDPREGNEATELDVADFLRQRWGMPASYVIAGYNDMAKVPDPAGGEALLIGIEAFIPAQAPVAAGHRTVGVGYGRLEAGGWYLVRRVNGHYDLWQVPAPPESSLVAVRVIRASPLGSSRAGSTSPDMTQTRRRLTTLPGSSADRRRVPSADHDR